MPATFSPAGPETNNTAGTATLSNVAAAVADTALLAANANRKGAQLYNDSSSAMYVKYGTGASTTSFTQKIAANSGWEMPRPIFTGALNGYWDTATGNARMTEQT